MPVSLRAGAARRILLWGGIMVLLAVAYGLFGFYGVPAILRSQASTFVTQKYQRTLQLGDIHFNPFTLELELRDFAFPDTDGKAMLGAHRLYVNLQLASLWNRGATFQDIQLEQPLIHAQQRTDGSLNLADLAKPFAHQPPSPATAPARLFLARLAVIGGDFTFIDLAHPATLHVQLHPVNFELRDFNTVGHGGNGYTLVAATPAGEQFNWSGTLEVSPIASQGQFSIKALQVTTLTGLAGPAVPLTVSSGLIGLQGGYDFRIREGVAGLKIDLQTLAITDLAVRPHDASSDYVVLPRIEIDGTHVDLTQRTVLVDAVTISGGQIHGWLNENGSLNLAALGGPAAPRAPDSSPTAPTATPAPPPATSSSSATPAWVIKVPKIELAALAVDFQDQSLKPAPTFTLSPLDLTVSQFQWPLGPPLDVQFKTGLDKGGTLSAQAQVTLPDAAAKAHVELAGFDLPSLQPYVARYTSLSLLSGKFGTKADIDAVHAAKNQPGGDIGVPGGIRTAQSFTRLGLIDEYVFMMHPVALGEGKRIFNRRTNLNLHSTKTYRSGVTRLIYRPR